MLQEYGTGLNAAKLRKDRESMRMAQNRAGTIIMAGHTIHVPLPTSVMIELIMDVISSVWAMPTESVTESVTASD